MVVKILEIDVVTHDVKRFRVERPDGYSFIPGQATDVAVNKPGFTGMYHPFTFTGLVDEPYLEFTIKGYPVGLYPNHEGLTEELHKLSVGDELLIKNPHGAISYKGPGVFIAGGAGVTPFIAIIRDLHKKGEINGNKLLFSNKTKADIILEKEFIKMLGKDNVVYTLTREQVPGYEYGRIDEDFLKKHVKDFGVRFYLCGPFKMVESLKDILSKLGANFDQLVFED